MGGVGPGGGTNKSAGGSLNSNTILWGGSPNIRYPLWGGSPNQISRDPKIGIAEFHFLYIAEIAKYARSFFSLVARPPKEGGT